MPFQKSEFQLFSDLVLYANYTNFPLQIYSKREIYLVNENLNNSINNVVLGPLKNELQNSVGRRKRKSEVRDQFAGHLHHNYCIFYSTCLTFCSLILHWERTQKFRWYFFSRISRLYFIFKNLEVFVKLKSSCGFR